ncbi:MAG: hypothetical protein JXQ73_30485 [Phycisphaerae bacterium]|nr:hypothetical protein [Phycisphaerae bacterium]
MSWTLPPLLSNIALHQLDMELKARGHRFVRYADDFQVFKTTWRAAYRVMDRLVQFLEKRMHLTVHRDEPGKTAPTLPRAAHNLASNCLR